MYICPECSFQHVNLFEKCEKCEHELDTSLFHDPNFATVSALTAQFEQVNDKPIEIKIGAPWNLASEVSVEFIRKIETKFRRKNKFHNFLTKNDLPNSVPNLLKSYSSTKASFNEVVKIAMQNFKVMASKDNRLKSLTGSNFIFIHYKTHEESDDGKLLVVMLDKKSGFDFESIELTPTKLSPIDTDALRQAALFDLTLFNVSYPMNNSEPYVRFIEGKSTSNFFKDALGCSKDVNNKRSASELFDALFSFSLEKKLTIPLRDKISDAFSELLLKKSKDKDHPTIQLRDIGKLIDKLIPESHPANGQFLNFINENDYKIDDVFEPTARSSVDAGSYELMDINKNFSCKVKKSSIGKEGSNKPLILDIVNRCLILPLTDEDMAILSPIAGE